LNRAETGARFAQVLVEDVEHEGRLERDELHLGRFRDRSWLVLGIALHMTGLFVKHLWGNNEYRFRLKKDMKEDLGQDLVEAETGARFAQVLVEDVEHEGRLERDELHLGRFPTAGSSSGSRCT
jgi:hypothetical protein